MKPMCQKALGITNAVSLDVGGVLNCESGD